jgi:phytoene/squalene synthetase
MVVAYFDDPTARYLEIAEIAAATGISETDVQIGLRDLSRASPPYVEAVRPPAELPLLLTLTGVTERALRETGQWPTPEAWVDRLVEALERAADEEPDEEKRSLLRRTAGVIGGMARDILVQVAAKVITPG